MKKFLSILLCMAMLLTVVTVPTGEDYGVSVCGLFEQEDSYDSIDDEN